MSNQATAETTATDEEHLWPRYPVQGEWEYLPTGAEQQAKTGSGARELHLREDWAEGINNGEDFVITRRLSSLAVEVKYRGQNYVLKLNALIGELLDKLDGGSPSAEATGDVRGGDE